MSNRADRRRGRKKGKQRCEKSEGSVVLAILFDFLLMKRPLDNPFSNELSGGKRLAYNIFWSLTLLIFGGIMLKNIVHDGISQKEIPFLIVMLLVVLVAVWLGIRAFRGRHRKPKLS